MEHYSQELDVIKENKVTEKTNSDINDHIKENKNTNEFKNPIFDLPMTSINCEKEKKIALKLKPKPNLNMELNSVKWNNSENNLNLTTKEYVFYLLNRFFHIKKKPKDKLIELAEEEFYKQMDTISIITKLQNLEKLKMILLNDDQITLFNYLSKPMLFVNDDSIMVENNGINSSQKKMTKMIHKEKIESSLVNIAFKNVLENEDKNEINKRLIELIDEKHIIKHKKKL